MGRREAPFCPCEPARSAFFSLWAGAHRFFSFWAGAKRIFSLWASAKRLLFLWPTPSAWPGGCGGAKPPQLHRREAPGLREAGGAEPSQ